MWGKEMSIFLIDPELTMQDSTASQRFLDTLVQELQAYAIEYILVKETNINRCKVKVDNNSLIVLFNGKIDTISGDKNQIYNFISTVKEKKALIWAIAIDRDSRIPTDIISEKQSYDVWEQLRCRNLSTDYLPAIAKAFSRKIITLIMPTIYSEKGMIFASHRRLDGEEITAKLCDKIITQSKESSVFRDVTAVEVGDEAQDVIDSAMAKCDAFIFIHTQKSSESNWIQKELRYALLRNIPVLWIQIDNASIGELRIKPTEKPHLSYNSADFEDDSELVKIVDEILHTLFELIILRNNKVFDSLNTLKELFDVKIVEHNVTNMIYAISVPRKGYHYPQRDIQQYVQLFGRTPTQKDRDDLKVFMNKNETEYDSSVMLTDRIVKSEDHGKMIVESFEDFYYHWNEYINPRKERKDMEIVISGAFPDSDEICKQSLTDALVIFAKSILKAGYTLTFGSHPTFQELFFEIAQEVESGDDNRMLNMYISKWFEEKYAVQKPHFLSHAQLIETEKVDTIGESLTLMRKEMIQRKKVSALVCLGGRIKENKSEEGIREEIQIAKECNIPIFIVGTVGGCSSQVASEYEKENWKELNNASSKLNKSFMESLDYFALSQEMISYLSAEETEK